MQSEKIEIRRLQKNETCTYSDIPSKQMTSRFQGAFSSDPVKAFGKHVSHSQSFPKHVDPVFQTKSAELRKNFPLETARANPAFTEEAMSAFGKKQKGDFAQIDSAFQSVRKNDLFAENTFNPFGKKVSKQYDPESVRNFVPENVLTADGSQWSSSALRKPSVKPALLIEEVEDFPPLGSKKMEEMFPVLGSNSLSTTSKSANSPKVSFSNLVKKRAEEDARLAEEEAKRLAKEREITRKRQEEIDNRKKMNALYKANTIVPTKKTVVDEFEMDKDEGIYEDPLVEEGDTGSVEDQDDEHEHEHAHEQEHEQEHEQDGDEEGVYSGRDTIW